MGAMMTHKHALEIVRATSKNRMHGPYDEDVILAAALAGTERGIPGIVAVLDIIDNDSLRGIADGAWPL
jgi:hypothetical protein